MLAFLCCKFAPALDLSRRLRQIFVTDCEMSLHKAPGDHRVFLIMNLHVSDSHYV